MGQLGNAMQLAVPDEHMVYQIIERHIFDIPLSICSVTMFGEGHPETPVLMGWSAWDAHSPIKTRPYVLRANNYNRSSTSSIAFSPSMIRSWLS
jgi:hypothetical protein